MNIRTYPIDGSEAAEHFSRFALPLAIKYKRGDPPWAKHTRATFTLMDTGEKKLFITCHHVLSALRDWECLDKSASICAHHVVEGASTLQELSEFRLIDEHERLDLAIFEHADPELKISGREFFDYSIKLNDPKIGEGVFVVGYPSCNVTITPDLADTGRCNLIFTSSQVSEHRIILSDERGDRKFTDYTGEKRTSINMGGMSGSPAFIIRDAMPYFAGIFTDGDSSDTVMISRLDFLRPDGTIDHGLIPN